MEGAAPQQPLGLGIFEFDDEGQIAGNSKASGGPKAGGKKKHNDDDDVGYTTVMLRNIPNKYTRQMLIDQLHRGGFKGDIDYMYLPTDFANRCNVGYCFVNFRESTARQRFVTAFDGVAAQSCLPGFNSYKVCQVTRAKWQGREDNVRRLKSSPELMAQLAAHTEWLPLLLDAEGGMEPFLCDDAITAARGPAAPRRQMRKKNQAMMQGFPGMPGMQDWAAMAAFGMGGEEMGGFSMGRGRGGGKGGGRRKGGGGSPSYQDMAAGSYAGVPAMMSVPVMTEQGLQYIPYDAYEGGMMMYSPMAPMDMHGMGMMPVAYGGGGYGGMGGMGGGYGGMGGGWGGDSGYPDAYGGAAAGVWPRPAGGKGAQHGRRRGGAMAAQSPFPVIEAQEQPSDDE